MTHRADFKSVELVDLRPFLPALRSGVRALRAQHRWARQAFLPTDAERAEEDAAELETLAEQIDRGRA